MPYDVKRAVRKVGCTKHETRIQTRMSAMAALNTVVRIGSQERFERLVDDVRKKALSFAMSLTRNRADADDLLQLAIVKAWTHFDTYQDDKPFQKSVCDPFS